MVTKKTEDMEYLLQHSVAVCNILGISLKELRSHRRLELYKLGRMYVIVKLRQRGWKLKEIAEAFERDHATIINALQQYENLKGNSWFVKFIFQQCELYLLGEPYMSLQNYLEYIQSKMNLMTSILARRRMLFRLGIPMSLILQLKFEPSQRNYSWTEIQKLNDESEQLIREESNNILKLRQ